MILKTLIDNLNTIDKRTLEYAADNNIAQFVKVGDGKFIGVYAERVPHLVAEQTAGVWSYGTIKGGSK
jgi:hypothetical protein